MNVLAVIVAAVVGYLGGRMLWLAMKSSWNVPTLMRENYRNVSLPTAGGFVFGLTLLVVEGVRALFGSFGVGEGEGVSTARAAALTVVLGFSVLGLLDDLIGDRKTKGLSGHLNAMRHGQLTTGGLKLFGGIAVAIAGAAFVSGGGAVALVLDAAIIALAANLGNLLDLRPGRASKVGIAAFVVMALVSGFDDRLIPVALVAGAAAALLLDEMHERLMLGDTGANALGAAVGLGLVTITGSTGRVVTVAVLLALTLLSEFVSFSKIIDSVGPLRSLDRMGRRRTPTSATRSTSNGPAMNRDRADTNMVDLRDEPMDDEDDDDLPPTMRTTMGAQRGTVEGAHVGAATGSRSREQSGFPPAGPGERAATRQFDADQDERFDFDRRTDRPAAPRRNSPFGDDE